jgi:hypothetical protein
LRGLFYTQLDGEKSGGAVVGRGEAWKGYSTSDWMERNLGVLLLDEVTLGRAVLHLAGQGGAWRCRCWMRRRCEGCSTPSWTGRDLGVLLDEVTLERAALHSAGRGGA